VPVTRGKICRRFIVFTGLVCPKMKNAEQERVEPDSEW
jgi:hypothetical protein